MTSRAWLPRLPVLPRDKSDTLLLLIACVMVLLPHVAHLPVWTSITCGLLLAWRGVITWRGDRLPPLGILLSLALLTFFGVYATAHTLLGREAGVTMLALLLTLKLLEMHARRDVFVVLFLSFFLVLTTFFYSQTIPTALFIIATVIALLTAQLSFQFTGAIPPLRRRLRMGALILALAAPLTLVLFLLFPRIQGPLWGVPDQTLGAQTGMSDSMAPGTISQLAQSDDIAFRIKFIDPVPASLQRYWRGAVLTNFDGRTWTRKPASMQSTLASNTHLASLKSGTLIRQQITMEASGQRWLFALETPQLAPTLTTNPPSQSHINSDRELLSDRPVGERIRYDVISVIDTHGLYAQASETVPVLQQALTLPAGSNPRAAALAMTLRSQASSDAEVVDKVLHFFRTENFSYTLEPPLLDVLSRNSVDEFLFSTQAGFCEHYAGAFVVLMRSAHIPARVVTGYLGGEMNPVDHFMTVRQSDAHAWAEVWLSQYGWVRVDPTAAVAPERINKSLSRILPRPALGGLINLPASPDGWLGTLQIVRVNWDAINNSWNQWVLNYTPERQKSLLESLGIGQLDWRMLTALMIALGSLGLALVSLPLLVVRNKIAPLDKVYSAFCKRMARLHMTRQIHEGASAYRQRLCATDSTLTPEAKSAIADFLQTYETLRYGPINGADHKTVSLAALKSQFNKLKPLLSPCR
ncbi:transglutaminase TgpA family protein [Glaciimonas sp. GG7]